MATAASVPSRFSRVKHHLLTSLLRNRLEAGLSSAISHRRSVIVLVLNLGYWAAISRSKGAAREPTRPTG
jgi:hypothetical protein